MNILPQTLIAAPIALAVPAYSATIPVNIEPTVLHDDTIFGIDKFEFTRPIQINGYSKIKNKIKTFSHLNDNWDGYEATSIDDAAIFNAIRFVSSLPENIIFTLNEENIVPTPYGTIVFDFVSSAGIVSVEIGNQTIGFFTEFQNNPDFVLEKALFNQTNLPVELISAFKVLHKEAVL